jgi:hypothetical protein
MITIFAFIAPLIIMYSQGYRFDVKKFRFVETGGIYVKAYPSEADVFLNNEIINKTSFFSRDILIKNLLPENHTVKVEKKDYHTWEKELTVEPKIVSEAKYIIMFKNNIVFSLIKDDIENFYPYPNKNHFLLVTASNELFSYDLETKKTNKVLDKYQTPYNISNIIFNSNAEKALIETSTGLYYLLSLEGNISLIKAFNSQIKNVNFDPKDENFFIYQFNNSIYRYNPKAKESPRLISREKVDSFTVHHGTIYAFISGNIVKITNLSKEEEIVFKDIFKTEEKSFYEILFIENNLFLIENNKNIYFLNEENKSFEIKIESDSEINYTSYFDKILFYNENKVWLMFLKKYETPFFKEAFSVINIHEFSEKIENIKWLNGDYFVFTIDKEAFVSEIDNRSNINMFSLDKKEISKIFFNGDNKKLLLLSKNNFLITEEKIMP